MDRQRKAASSKITDYRRFHLSGDLEQIVQGKVSNTIEILENTPRKMSQGAPVNEPTPEQLQELIQERNEGNSKLQQQVEAMKLNNELEVARMQQDQWKEAIAQLKQVWEQMELQHADNIGKIRALSQDAINKAPSQAVAWFQDQVCGPTNLTLDPEREPRARNPDQEQKLHLLEQLKKQQHELQQQIDSIACETTGHDKDPLQVQDRTQQEALMEQIKSTLNTARSEKDNSKALLRALISAQNKTTGVGGTSTLRPELASRLATDNEFSMAEWLASLNKQEEGELEVNKLFNRIDDEYDCRTECRHAKMKSGMLDRSSTNIKHKEVWPQKNLGEDWAEEEIEFKQLRFEHLVAGETRAIETCTDPAQILGRLKLLRRIAYLKLHGIEWPLLRKIYAAILSSIETREYSWESNFDRFESILYRKVLTEKHFKKEHKEQRPDSRKRFCRDYNKPDGCTKNSPHAVWSESGPNAVRKLVYHCCAACLIRDKVAREHPEGHQECPHHA